MKVVYISGPYRADTEWEVKENIERAERAALYFWRKGCAVICPHKNTAFFGGAAPDSTWLRGDLELLKRSDAIVLLPGWERSEGAKIELLHANFWGKEVIRWDGQREMK